MRMGSAKGAPRRPGPMSVWYRSPMTGMDVMMRRQRKAERMVDKIDDLRLKADEGNYE